jgi:hypothetical protein
MSKQSDLIARDTTTVPHGDVKATTRPTCRNFPLLGNEAYPKGADTLNTWFFVSPLAGTRAFVIGFAGVTEAMLSRKHVLQLADAIYELAKEREVCHA